MRSVNPSHPVERPRIEAVLDRKETLRCQKPQVQSKLFIGLMELAGISREFPVFPGLLRTQSSYAFRTVWGTLVMDLGGDGHDLHNRPHL